MAGIDSYTKLLIRGGGANGSTSFSDVSDNSRTITTTGSWLTHSTAATKFQTSSIKLICYGASYCYAADSTDFEYGTGDFTIDFWINVQSLSYAIRICEKTYYITVLTNGKLYFTDSNSGATLTSTNAISTGSWVHVALVRSGTTFTFYIGGTANGSITNSGSISATSNNFKLGTNSANSSTSTAAYLDEFRVSKGIARWTADFTPPTAAYTAANISLTHTASGGAVAGGESTVKIPQISITSAGGGVAGGSFDYHYSTWRQDGAGGAVAGGAAEVRVPFLTMSAAGGALAGGEAGILGTMTFPVSGGAVAGGEADIVPYLHIQPIHHWKCNVIEGSEFSKTTPDSISGGTDLSVFYARTTETGKFNNGIAPASSSFVVAFPGSVQNYVFESIALWFRRGNTANVCGLLGNASATNQIYIAVDHDIKLLGGGSVTSSGATVSDTDWHHLAVVKGSTNAKILLYLDGALVGSEWDKDWSAGVYAFGAYGGAPSENCGLDNIQFYDRKLTAEEVLFLATAQSEDYALPMEFVGDGGAIAGGSANWEFPLSFVGEGGAVAGGSATVKMLGLSTPTQHWTFGNIVDGVVQNEVSGGAVVYAEDRSTTTDPWGGDGLLGGEVGDNPLTISTNVSFQSISMWVKKEPNSWAGYAACFPTGQPAIGVDFSQSRVVVYGGTGNAICSVPLSGTDWQHIVVVIPDPNDNTAVYVYVNGVRDPNLLEIGSFGTIRYLSYWPGSSTPVDFPSLDNIQLYDRALTQEDVDYLYGADSDLTTCPRLPYLEPTASGGAVAGGASDYYMRNVNFSFTASGGAVGGGRATLDFVDFDCALELPTVDIDVHVTNVAVLDATLQLPTVSIDTAGNFEAILEFPTVDITVQHTVSASLEAILALPVVEVTTISTLLASIDTSLELPTVDITTLGSYCEMECVLSYPVVDIRVDAGEAFSGVLAYDGYEVVADDYTGTMPQVIVDILVNAGTAEAALCYSR